MHDPVPYSADVPHYPCPNCRGLVAAAAGERLLVCPVCGEQFFISDEFNPGAESSQEHPSESARESELNELRIRQVSSLRRGAFRSRSWCVIAAGGCIVGAAQLVQMAVHDLRRGTRILPIGFFLAAAAALLGSGYFIRAAVRLTRELQQPSLPDPPAPPDFSTLSDGSQHWRNLDELSGREQ